jgi:hypothetical protein
MQWCEQRGAAYFECSAKDGAGVEEGFKSIGKSALVKAESDAEVNGNLYVGGGEVRVGPGNEDSGGVCAC